MQKGLKQNRSVEKIILIMFVINYVFMIFSAINLKWNTWMPTFMLIECAVSVIIYVGNYFEYDRRAQINTILIMVSVAIYSMHSGQIGPIIVPIIAQIVLIGFYDIDRLLIYPAIALTVIVFYHAVVMESFTISSVDDVYNTLVPIGNSYMILLYVHFWGIRKHRREKELEKIMDELREAEQGKDDFMANVSHEIRTPINSISGMSEIVLKSELSDNVRSNVENIKLSCKRLMTIVDDLIDFSDLRSGRYEINEMKYSIDSTVNDIVNFAYSIKKDKSIEIIVDCDSSMPRELIGDERKIKRVICNILSNAVKFTSVGCIAIKIGYRRESYGINLAVTIKDTGIGIDKHDMEKIFSSFNQVDSKRNRQEGGLGLGLPIARAIVEQMNGVITVTSEPGVGSEFKVVIPQKVAEQEPIIAEDPDLNANILAYVDMEQFHLMQIRDEYRTSITNMSTNINVPVHLCHNLAEFKRRVGLKQYTHYFISLVEYNEDKKYFNELAEKSGNVIVVIDRYQEDEIESDKIIKLMKPLYIFPVMMALMGISNKAGTYITTDNFKKFTAPEAHVLIVDDDPVNLKVASGLMKAYEVKTDVAGSGAEALKMVDSEMYDIIFLDHMMPDMDGIETFRRLRKKNGFYFKEVPVIALTANTVLGAREMFLDEGFVDFLPKPIEVSALKRVLKTYIPSEKIIMENDMPESDQEEMDSMNAMPEQENIELSDDFIDYEQGISYCGSQENLMEVLQLHYEDGNENWNKIKKAYDNADWKNYVIYVHGLKSSMKSVGINKLSNMAKDLESAGKEENIDYILKNNEALLVEYSRVIDGLEEIFGDGGKEERDLSDLKEIDAEELKKISDEFEEIVYSFDADRMMQVINELKQCSYDKIALENKLAQIEKKVVNSDYMSAADALKRLTEEIITEGDAHAL